MRNKQTPISHAGHGPTHKNPKHPAQRFGAQSVDTQSKNRVHTRLLNHSPLFAKKQDFSPLDRG